MSNLATIQKIQEIKVHSGADSLELATILGWTVVVKKGEFHVNDLVVYICIDSILPDKPEFEFLRDKHFRIKPIRLRGIASAGICFPLSILPEANAENKSPYWYSGSYPREGDDVTDLIGVTKYDKPIPAELAGKAIGGLPGFLIMTDEDNLRNYPNAIPEMFGRPFYISSKVDGSSGTFFIKNGEFGVCSRRIHLMESEGNGFWRIARKYDIENVLKNAFPNMDIAIQGEVYGEGIQKNPVGIKGIDINIFNIFDISKRLYLSYDELVKFTKNYNIPMVPVISEGESFGYTLEELVKLANEQKYPNGQFAEGIVVRPQEPFMSSVLDKYWSGKVINENYKDKT